MSRFSWQCGMPLSFTSNVLIMQEEKNCTTALILACQSGHKAIAELLIDKGANVDYQDKVLILRLWVTFLQIINENTLLVEINRSYMYI